MIPSLMIVDDFYEDPNKIRISALNKSFDFIADYPGMRTIGIDLEESEILKNKFESLLNLKITEWNTFSGKDNTDMNTCYQLCLKEEKTWIHHDYTDWAAVIYLTPNANLDSGTGFFQHKQTGISRWNKNNTETDFNRTADMYDLDKWQITAEVKNKFNRMILYPGELYHRSMLPGFGNNYVNGRLTQVFFFNTTKK